MCEEEIRPEVPKELVDGAQADSNACGHGVITWLDGQWVRMNPETTVVFCNIRHKSFEEGFEEGKRAVFGG